MYPDSNSVEIAYLCKISINIILYYSIHIYTESVFLIDIIYLTDMPLTTEEI